MKEILKRLEIVKSALSIEDDEIIELQLLKLKKLKVDDKVKTILDALKDGSYSSAFKAIDAYLARYSGVVVYEDKELEALRFELKELEKEFQKLAEQKDEIVKEIDEFNRLYHLKLGDIIREILEIKKEIAKKEQEEKQRVYSEKKELYEETKSTKEEIEEKIKELEEILEEEESEQIREIYDELKSSLDELEEELEEQEEELDALKNELEDDEYDKLKNEYEEFYDEYEEIIKEESQRIEIDEDDLKKLKKYFKQASRLCHPDLVKDELKEQATKIMQTLNEAYSKRDVEAVKKILHNLKEGIAFEVASDVISDKKILKAKIDEIRKKANKLKTELEEIKKDEIYDTVSTIDNLDEYFDSVKDELLKEFESLKSKLKGESKEDKIEEIEDTSYHHHLQNIELINFEKIRRYCNNLLKKGEADEMQEYLALNANIHKALIYDALDRFIEDFEGKSLQLIDWGCDQGLGSSLVVDYVTQKQLDIEIKRVILIESDKKRVSRAVTHIEALWGKKPQSFLIRDNNFLEAIEAKEEMLTLNLFVNDNMLIECKDIKNDMFKDEYCLVVSNKDREFVENIYDCFSLIFAIDELSNRDTKIGRFYKYERIFRVLDDTNIPSIDIDEDEISF